MKKMTLTEINEQYEQIIHSSLSDDRKTRQMSDLMTYMEREYKVPILQSKKFEEENKKVIALYRKISLSRPLL